MKKTAALLGLVLAACGGDSREMDMFGPGDDGTGYDTGDDGGDDGADPDGDDGGSDGGDDGGDDGGTGGDDGETGGEEGDTGDDGGGDGGCGPSGGSGGAAGMSTINVGSNPASYYHVPSGYNPAEAVPMVVTLHGSGDSPDNFIHWFPDANVPETVITLTPGGEDRSGWAETDIPLILEAIDEMAAQYNIDTCRIYLMGFSAGAHMSYIIGLQHADQFAGFGSIAGNIQYAESWGIWPNMVPRKIAVDIHHGTLDGIQGAQYSRDQLEGQGHTVYYTELQGVGHTLTAQWGAEMWANLKDHRVDE